MPQYSMPVSLILGLEPAIDLASIVLRRFRRPAYSSHLAPISRPLVFHCSHGIHRTGTAAAILLSVLGVPWETVREDYLLSNTYRKDEIEHRLTQLRDLYAENNGIAPEDVDTTNMDAFYILQGAYIDAALEQAVADYGSMEAYVRDGLGITDEEVEQLRSQLLEKPVRVSGPVPAESSSD